MIEPGSLKSITSSLRRLPWVAATFTGNILSAGPWNPIVMTWRLCARLLPVRRKKGTPCHRQLSTTTFAAMNVSVWERFDTLARRGSPCTAPHDLAHVDRTHRFEDLRPSRRAAPWRSSDDGGSIATKPSTCKQVGHDHVAVRAGLVVELGPSLDRQRLGHVDLHVAHVVAIPDGLEQPVRESERQDVVDRLLPEEVVDAEDARLVEHGVHGRVQCASALEVVAERLLDDHVRVLVRARSRRASTTTEPNATGGTARWCRSLGCPPIAFLAFATASTSGSGVVGIGGAEVERGLERLPRVARRLDDAELADRVLGVLAELRRGDREARR